MFAEIFSDIITPGYQFWGHIDVSSPFKSAFFLSINFYAYMLYSKNDMVLANLLNEDFLSPATVGFVDIVSSSHSMCNGPLQLYRNIPEVNSL
jgi:hypothetical protein